MLGHSNTWPEAVLGRFNTSPFYRLLSSNSSSTYTKATFQSSFEPFQAVFEQIGSDFEQFQHNFKNFCENLSDLSGFKSEGGCERCEGRC